MDQQTLQIGTGNMGEVVKTQRAGWWNKVERTETEGGPRQQVIIQTVSLDVLANQVRLANNALVIAQTEAEKKLRHYELCQQALSNRMIEVARESGIREIRFCALPTSAEDD